MDENPNPTPSDDDPAGQRALGSGTTTAQQERPLPPPRRLTRRSDEEVIGGVCAGLGAYFRIDPVVFRIAFVIAAFASGAGVIGYLIAWAIIPDEDGRAEVGGGSAEEPVGDTPPWVWVALAVAAVVVLGGFTVRGGPSLLIAAGLVGFGILLIRRDTAGQHAAGAHVSAVERHEAPAGSWGATAAGDAGAPPAPAPAPKRPPSPLVRLTLGLAVAAVGVMLALQVGTAIAFRPVAWTAVPLGIIGGGLLIGAVVGGARALIGWGVAVLVAMLITAGGVVVLSGPTSLSGARGVAAGEVIERPQAVEDLLGSYSLGMGELRLDLRGLGAEELAGVSVTGNVGMGSLEVLLDGDVPVEVEGQAGIGQVDLLDRGTEGGVGVRRSLADPVDAASPLRLDLRAGIGEVVVERS